MKIKVNSEACIGCGACEQIAKDLFEIGDDGVSKAKVSEVPEDKKAMAQEAIDGCPTELFKENN